MNIAFFVTDFPSLSETFIANQVIALQDGGHSVHIFSRQKPVGDKIHGMVIDAGLLKNTSYVKDMPSSRIGKITLLLWSFIKYPSAKNFRKVFNVAFKYKSSLSVYDLIPYLDKPEYDVLHAHFGINGNYVVELRKLGLFPKARFITTFHGYDLNPVFKSNSFYEMLFSDCNLFTVNTNYSKQLLMGLGCKESKISILPAGLSTIKFKRTIEKDNNTIIQLLFVGRLIKLKGVHQFIEICHLLKKNKNINFRATLIGQGVLYKLLEQVINDNDLKNEIQLAGAKTQEQIVQFMNEADIFVFPGIKENNMAEAQGLVIQEAQAMELPVLISDVGGMAEGILDGITGYVLPENNSQDFGDKIELLANDFYLRKKMGEAGRKFVEDNYDIFKLNERLLQLYQCN